MSRSVTFKFHYDSPLTERWNQSNDAHTAMLSESDLSIDKVPDSDRRVTTANWRPREVSVEDLVSSWDGYLKRTQLMRPQMRA